MKPARETLTDLFRIAVRAAHPATVLPSYLPNVGAHDRVILLAAGKAAGSMIETAERHYLKTLDLPIQRLAGLGVTSQGFSRPTQTIRIIEGGHPIPDVAGLAASTEVLELARSATEHDLVIALLSNAAAANWIVPAPGISLAEKQAVTRGLFRSGASPDELKVVRNHVSSIKGGRLARAAFPAQIVTLAIAGPIEDPSMIGFGPTVPDPSTLADAQSIVGKYRLDLPQHIRSALDDPDNETLKSNDPIFARTEFHVVASPRKAFEAAATAAREAGYEPIVGRLDLEGEARDVAIQHADMALGFLQLGRRVVMFSGGELTTTLRGSGRGGPNQEYALAFALAINGKTGLSVLSADTGGADGRMGLLGEPAGAFANGFTVQRAHSLGLEADEYLKNNDSTSFFEKLGDLIETGVTYTDVNDFRAILIDPSERSGTQ